MALRVGVLGLGSVFWTPYRNLIKRLSDEGRVELVAGYDPDPAKREVLTSVSDADTNFSTDEELIAREDLDLILILTSMNEHGRLVELALSEGKHVLVEKPMATTLDEAANLITLSKVSAGQLMCAPHIVLSPTYREIHRRAHGGVIGRIVLARARYGWSGPWWAKWFYEPGGGALFDLGVYNVTSLCGIFGPVRRVTAMVGTAIPSGSSRASRFALAATIMLMSYSTSVRAGSAP